MDIAFAFDEGYADYTRVAIEMILEEHEWLGSTTLWLLAPRNVWSESGSLFREQCRGRAEVHLLETDDAFRSLPSGDDNRVAYISAGMYLRLLLPALLPASVERYLYLDADTMCLGDLRPLFAMDLAGSPIAAVGDAFTLTCADIPGAGDDIGPEMRYFNSGVLLVDAERWREMHITEQCFEYIAKNKGQLRFPDQDALNLAIRGRWFRLGREWNHMRSWRLEPADEEYDPAERMPRIMHFAGPWKPWYNDFDVGHRRDRYVATATRLGLPIPQYDAAA